MSEVVRASNSGKLLEKLLYSAKTTLCSNAESFSWPIVETLQLLPRQAENPSQRAPDFPSWNDRVISEVTTCTGQTILINCAINDACNLCTLVWRFSAYYTGENPPYKESSAKAGRSGYEMIDLLMWLFRNSPSDGPYYKHRNDREGLRHSARNYSNSIGRLISRSKPDDDAELGLAALSCTSWSGFRINMASATPLCVLAALATVGTDNDPSIAQMLLERYGIEVSEGRLDQELCIDLPKPKPRVRSGSQPPRPQTPPPPSVLLHTPTPPLESQASPSPGPSMESDLSTLALDLLKQIGLHVTDPGLFTAVQQQLHKQELPTDNHDSAALPTVQLPVCEPLKTKSVRFNLEPVIEGDIPLSQLTTETEQSTDSQQE